MDIRSTLSAVCRKVTRDKGPQCSDELLLKRCQALKLLGEYFLAHGGTTESGLNDLKARLKQKQQQQLQPHDVNPAESQAKEAGRNQTEQQNDPEYKSSAQTASMARL